MAKLGKVRKRVSKKGQIKAIIKKPPVKRKKKKEKGSIQHTLEELVEFFKILSE